MTEYEAQNPERQSERPATSEQVQEILSEVGRLTTLEGKQNSDRFTYGKDAELPGEVEKHVPELEANSVSHKDSVYLTQMIDRSTGMPLYQDTIAIVSFTRLEHRDKDLRYATTVNYHVNRDNDDLSMERHVTHTEHGPHMIDQPPMSLEEMSQIRDNLEEDRETERALGISTVSQGEAQAIIDALKD